MSVPSFDIPLWAICTVGSLASVFLYAMLGAVVAAVTKRLDGDSCNAVAAGIFWPIVAPIYLLLIVPLWVYRSLTKGCRE